MTISLLSLWVPFWLCEAAMVDQVELGRGVRQVEKQVMRQVGHLRRWLPVLKVPA